MDKRNEAIRFLVVTPNVVVGEDLREAFAEYGGADVKVHATLNAAWGVGYQLAVFGGALDAILSNRRIRSLHDSGTQIVVLNGDFPKSLLSGTGVLPLSQPFDTDDIRTLLQQAGLLVEEKSDSPGTSGDFPR